METHRTHLTWTVEDERALRAAGFVGPTLREAEDHQALLDDYAAEGAFERATQAASERALEA